ncbi:hypothetical protein MUG84_08825 [Paenibacillus sp. KQZ6P-2]|uniref:Uncharacterized protein n=1 Tax=Paenibacillus mangrovi TaxID=2931978 RepID=A0A9X1WMU9_9BACL|nr:hypothetical protein [Paenibacillus mangrovi]MCJ8011843.1 hypothetical protein [Paenibacillus mangrovi]
MVRNEGTSAEIRLFEGEKWLVLTSILGFLLSAFCGLWVVVFGKDVAPSGNILNAFSFNAAIGIFLLSTAAILPYSGLGRKSKAFIRYPYIALTLYAYAAETVQNFRGVNPRFVRGGSPFDVAVGSIFAFVALLLILFYLVPAIAYFRSKVYRIHPELVTGIRYAMLAVILSFAAGIWISTNQGRVVGLHGNIIWLHGLGFHALQAVPLVAWLAVHSSLSRASRIRMIHLTGISYILGLLAIGWQTVLGHAILEWSLLPVAAGICFLISLCAGIFVLRNTEANRIFKHTATPASRRTGSM